MFFSAMAVLLVRAQPLIGHSVVAKVAMQLPDPQSHSLAVPSLETAANNQQ